MARDSVAAGRHLAPAALELEVESKTRQRDLCPESREMHLPSGAFVPWPVRDGLRVRRVLHRSVVRLLYFREGLEKQKVGTDAQRTARAVTVLDVDFVYPKKLVVLHYVVRVRLRAGAELPTPDLFGARWCPHATRGTPRATRHVAGPWLLLFR